MLRQLAKFLAPPCCLSCNKEGSLVCRDCWPRVFRPVHAECLGVSGIVAAGAYANVLKQLIARLKYSHQREAAEILARALLPSLECKRFEYNFVTAVPVVTSRLRQRGYNQSELIAKHLARGLALPYCRALVRLRATRQVGKSRLQRQEHVEGAFAAKSGIHGRKVLVIDDVFTTGATLAECAKALKAAGAVEISAAVGACD